MKLTKAQQRIKARRAAVISAYKQLTEQDSVSVLVAELAQEYQVTEVTIYADIKAGK